MPSTFDDLGFTERMDVLREGWQDPAVGGSTYQQLMNVETDGQAMERQVNELGSRVKIVEGQNNLAKATDMKGYCAAHPDDPDCDRYLKATDFDAWCQKNYALCKSENPNVWRRLFPNDYRDEQAEAARNRAQPPVQAPPADPIRDAQNRLELERINQEYERLRAQGQQTAPDGGGTPGSGTASAPADFSDKDRALVEALRQAIASGRN
jgi:hypothetical protein